MPLHQSRTKSWFGGVLALVGFILFIESFQVYAQKPVVFVAPIEGVIDLGLAPFVQRVLEEAATAKASAVVLDINTFGGRVDAAVLIRDALLESKILTVAFINKRAISAGALISLATEKIAMADGGTIGAATPVQIGLPGAPAQPVAEKTVSYMRKEFRATAEHRNRPALIAEAMVDADVEIPGIIQKGKLLTLTTKEALDVKVADFQANTLEAVLQSLDLGDADIRHASETWAETLVRFLTHPVVSSLLMTLGIMGIIVEIRVPGFGLPGLMGLVSLGLFFWGHTLVRLAGLEEFPVSVFRAYPGGHGNLLHSGIWDCRNLRDSCADGRTWVEPYRKWGNMGLYAICTGTSLPIHLGSHSGGPFSVTVFSTVAIRETLVVKNFTSLQRRICLQS